MGVKISNLPSIVTPALSDVFPVVQAGVTYKETITQLSALLSGNGDLVTQAEVQQSAFNFATLAGSSNAFTVTLSPTVTSLTDGMIVTFYSGSKNNTIENPTLSVDGLPAVTIVCWSGGLAPFDIAPSTEYLCIYNASENVFQLTNPSISSANTFEVQSNDYNYATDTGVANAYIANIVPAQLTNNSGLYVVMTALHANSGASTLTVNGVTHPILLSNGAALAGGEILVNGLYLFIYSDALTGFILMNSSSVSAPANPNVTFTGTWLGGYQFSLYNSSIINNAGFTQNITAATFDDGNAESSLLTLNLGGIQQINAGFSPTMASLTSFSAPSLLNVTGAFSPVMASLTTLSIPLLTNITTALSINAPILTTFSAPQLKYIGTVINATLSAATTVSMPNLIYIGTNITWATTLLTTLSLPSLVTIAGVFNTASMPALTTLSMPSVIFIGALGINVPLLTTLTLTSLVTIGGAFAMTAAVTSLSLPALVTVSGAWTSSFSSCTSVTLTNFTTMTGAFSPSFASLTTLSLPAIVTFGSTITITAANLVTFSFGSTLKSVGGNVTMTGMKLDQASVDGILVSLAALDGTGGTTAYSGKVVNLSGGTSATPSATGLAAKVVLVGRGCTVTNN